MVRKTGIRTRLEKTASLDQAFTAAANEDVFIPEIGMHLRTINVTQEYAGHALEEYGDEFKAEVEIELGARTQTYSTDWYLRQDPPGLVWTVGGYEICILGCRTGRLYKNRNLFMTVVGKKG